MPIDLNKVRTPELYHRVPNRLIKEKLGALLERKNPKSSFETQNWQFWDIQGVDGNLFLRELEELFSIFSCSMPSDVSQCLDRAEIIAYPDLNKPRREHLETCLLCIWCLFKYPKKD